jgi:hypothetical protein
VFVVVDGQIPQLNEMIYCNARQLRDTGFHPKVSSGGLRSVTVTVTLHGGGKGSIMLRYLE